MGPCRLSTVYRPAKQRVRESISIEHNTYPSAQVIASAGSTFVSIRELALASRGFV